MAYEMKTSAEVLGTAEAVWQLLTDVNNWPTWDPHEEAARLDGPFKLGAKIWSKPRGGPAADSVVTQLDEGWRWTAQCPLPFGKLSGETVLNAQRTGVVQLTKKIRVTGPLALLFRLYFGPRIRRDHALTYKALQNVLQLRSQDARFH